MKIVTVVGARPQFIKAAAVSRALKPLPSVQEIIVHTGQHYDDKLSEVFFRELDIPKPDLNIEVGSGTHGTQTGRMLEAIEKVLLDQKPEWVLVYGDTNSTLAGALAAAKLHIPVAHIEAGLRSFNRYMPEEINRVVTDHISEILFAPTDTAIDNLRREGISGERVKNVGDVMYDVALYYGTMAEKESDVLDRFSIKSKGYILATIHRAENTDDPDKIKAIFDGLSLVHRKIPVVLPLHLRTRKILEALGCLDNFAQKIQLIEPVGYLDMIMLEKNASLIVTDSGGVQKEAFFHHVPCITLRTETEWIELIDLGWNRLVPPVTAETVRSEIINAKGVPQGLKAEPYGNGHSAEKIVCHILDDSMND